MVGICFQREAKGWMQDQWSYVFSNFGITDVWELRQDDNRDMAIYQKPIPITSTIELPDTPLVVLQPENGKHVQGNKSLINFNHPENVIYLFGGSHSVLSLDDIGERKPDHIVYIPLVKHECYSFSAAYVTLWDRRMKRGYFG